VSYVTGAAIRALREGRKLTQRALAEQVGVSDKTVSKWETGRGLPDVGLLEPLAAALEVSVAELLTGQPRRNDNVAGNMKKVRFSVCPVCGNIIQAVGQGSFSCCGIPLPPLEPEPLDEEHPLTVETVEEDYYLTVDHPMTKEHYLSFFAWVTSDTVELRKLYPEQGAEVRFRKRGPGLLYLYCNRHGLYRTALPGLRAAENRKG
jgi:DNA-binding XRE family transcriptional regulator